MNQFFDYNNNVFRILGGLADCLILGALWIVCSIPVVTMGAATAAVYHAVNKSIVHGQGYAFREYCTALKTDLKQTTGAWLLWGILAAFLAADLVVTRQFLAQGSALGALYYFFIVLSAMALAWEFYLTAYMARFEGNIRIFCRLFNSQKMFIWQNLPIFVRKESRGIVGISYESPLSVNL